MMDKALWKKTAEAVCRRFRVLEDARPDWIRDMENLLVSLELYRLQEETALKKLACVFSVYSREITEKKTEEPGMERPGRMQTVKDKSAGTRFI